METHLATPPCSRPPLSVSILRPDPIPLRPRPYAFSCPHCHLSRIIQFLYVSSAPSHHPAPTLSSPQHPFHLVGNIPSPFLHPRPFPSLLCPHLIYEPCWPLYLCFPQHPTFYHPIRSYFSCPDTSPSPCPPPSLPHPLPPSHSAECLSPH